MGFSGEWLKEWAIFLLTTHQPRWGGAGGEHRVHGELEGFLCVLRVLRGETIGQAHTIIHSYFPHIATPKPDSVKIAICLPMILSATPATSASTCS